MSKREIVSKERLRPAGTWTAKTARLWITKPQQRADASTSSELKKGLHTMYSWVVCGGLINRRQLAYSRKPGGLIFLKNGGLDGARTPHACSGMLAPGAVWPRRPSHWPVSGRYRRTRQALALTGTACHEK